MNDSMLASLDIVFYSRASVINQRVFVAGKQRVFYRHNFKGFI
jgi:hypothetical protein